ncbi:high affinity copper uptake protein 1-like [Acanthaster planci]|uniref:Copper transport protein n=1 Tax=Acanthaster planci TaxID=133434 RepID=A0A8B7XZM8_ACAPL|nr:high affinity copper uptake protein 1-like [Acanthaster planci]
MSHTHSGGHHGAMNGTTMMPSMHSGMDHGGHSGVPGMTHPPGHNMGHSMVFYFSDMVTILFQGWHVNTVGALVGSCFAVFFMAMFYEGLKVFRETLLRRSAVNVRFHSMQLSKSSEAMLTETHSAGESRILSVSHFIQTLLHMVQVTISYFLMLIFMTFNGWLCISVVLGAGMGYFVFGWKRAIIVDVNEHCH